LVELDVLAALDGLQWLGTGQEVSQRFGISQPTVSRSCSKALQVFGLSIERIDGEWELVGDQAFLRLERAVHQRARWLGHRPLRLEATYWSAPTVCRALPPTWLLGRSNIVGVKRNLQLIQDRVVDAWVAGLPDVPGADQPDLAVIVLSEMPVFYTCAPGHPLLAVEPLSVDAIADYPTLALPEGSYPKVEQALRRLGLWNDASRMTRYRRDKWEGRSEQELVVGYGTPLSMAVSGAGLCRLPLRLPIDSGDAVVVHKDCLAHPALAELLGVLRANLRGLARQHGDIRVVS
jgi:hypothetical protein